MQKGVWTPSFFLAAHFHVPGLVIYLMTNGIYNVHIYCGPAIKIIAL